MAPLHIRSLTPEEPLPMKLLLLADPSLEMIDRYIHHGSLFVADQDDHILGVYVLINTLPAGSYPMRRGSALYSTHREFPGASGKEWRCALRR